MKRILTITMALILLLSTLSFAGEMNKDSKYLDTKELDGWGILAMYANGIDVSNKSLSKVDTSKVTTDYEAYVMGALPLGKDASDYTKKIINSQMENGKFSDYIEGNGDELVNAHIWGIISLYAANAENYDKEKALEWLKNNQNEDGGFAIFTNLNDSDLDLTSMGIIAYKSLGLNKDSSEIKKAIAFVEENLNKRESSETISWYIMARISLGLDVDSSLYRKLQEYNLSAGGFKHLKGSSKPNYMATWHGMLAEADYKNKVSTIDKLHNSNKFIDLKKIDYGYSEIMTLVNKDIVSGYTDNTFKSDNKVKRSEFAKFIVYGLDIQNQISIETNKFTDLKGHWSNKIVNVAVKNNLIQGVGNEKFAPEDKITGAEVATILVRAKGLENEAKVIKGSNWYDGYVKVAKENNLLYENFKANEYATRAQCAVSIYKIMR